MNKAVRFLKIRGRIVPIFGSKAKMQAHEDKISAIRKVREALSGKLNMEDMSGGEVKKVFSDKNTIVKSMWNEAYLKNTPPIERLQKEVTINKMGKAPKTFLIQTRRNNYFVQEKVSPSADWFRNFSDPQVVSDVVSSEIEHNAMRIRKKVGVDLQDIHFSNLGYNKNGIQFFDAGHSKFLKAPTRIARLKDWYKNLAKFRSKAFHVTIRGNK